MKRFVLTLLVLCVALTCAPSIGQAQDADEKYKPGQKWSYKNRPGEEESYLIILKIDKDPKLGNIIHIAVHNLKIKNPRSPDGFTNKVGHMPFSQEAIDKSGLKLLQEKTDLPDFAEGYQMWRRPFDDGRAGIYSITVAEAVKVIETGLNPQPPGETDENPPPNAKVAIGMMNGRAVKLVKPNFPHAARMVGASGTVEVRIVCDETGKVIWARAVDGHPNLRKSAERAAMKSEFMPTIREGQAVTVSGTIIYNFVAH